MATEGTSETAAKSQTFKGGDARRKNILVARVIAETLKTTLGPKGSKKLLVDQTGDTMVTGDGAAILKKIHVVQPIAKVMVDLAKTQEAEAGDGTTTAVVLAGELLKRAEDLVDQGVHPTVIARGYRIAGQCATKYLERLARKIVATDTESLRHIATTSLNSVASPDLAVYLSTLAVEAVRHVTNFNARGNTVAKEHITIVKQEGKSIRESELVPGLVIVTDERISKTAGAPTLIKDARVATVSAEMGLRTTKTNAEIDIASSEQLQSFYREMDEALDKVMKLIVNSRANVVFNYMTIDERLMHFLARRGILSVKSIPERDLEKIAVATGAKVVKNVNELAPNDVGKARMIEVKKVAGSEFIFITGCDNPKAVTLFLRGGGEGLLRELEGSMDDAVSAVRDVIEEPALLPGGGAAEMEAAMKLNKFAKSIPGREQLAILEFAKALEAIPKILAENAGFDPIDTLIELRLAHHKGKRNHGMDVQTGKPADMYRLHVIDALKVKRHAVVSATETAVQILRVNDVVPILQQKDLMGEIPGTMAYPFV